MSQIKASLIGGSGFIGGEVLRLLISHPDVELISVSGHSSVGQRVDELQPNLRGLTDLVYVPHSEAADADVTFLSLPHGESESLVPSSGKVIDLSGDHRLFDAELRSRHYGDFEPFVTGIPEIGREKIREARCVAAAGCFATAAILGVHPLAQMGHVAGRVIVDGKTGSSGSGAKPKAATLHGFREGSLLGYGMFSHRHQPEMEQSTGVEILFQPHSTPLVRGVFTTSYIPLDTEIDSANLLEIYQSHYDACPFVRLQQGSPNVLWTRGSNFIDIGVQSSGRTAIVFSAVDNLVKGGAGQGIQCMNLMFGLEETRGLMTPAMLI